MALQKVRGDFTLLSNWALYRRLILQWRANNDRAIIEAYAVVRLRLSPGGEDLGRWALTGEARIGNTSEKR